MMNFKAAPCVHVEGPWPICRAPEHIPTLALMDHHIDPHAVADVCILLHHLQGILLKRHKISGALGRQLTPRDIQAGQIITLYGRTYQITSVDAFTRHYLTERGIPVAPDEQIPACPYDAWLAAHNAPGEFILYPDPLRLISTGITELQVPC